MTARPYDRAYFTLLDLLDIFKIEFSVTERQRANAEDLLRSNLKASFYDGMHSARTNRREED